MTNQRESAGQYVAENARFINEGRYTVTYHDKTHNQIFVADCPDTLTNQLAAYWAESNDPA